MICTARVYRKDVIGDNDEQNFIRSTRYNDKQPTTMTPSHRGEKSRTSVGDIETRGRRRFYETFQAARATKILPFAIHTRCDLPIDRGSRSGV